MRLPLSDQPRYSTPEYEAMSTHILVITYSPSMNGIRPESTVSVGTLRYTKALWHYEITGMEGHRREPPKTNPSVGVQPRPAGSRRQVVPRHSPSSTPILQRWHRFGRSRRFLRRRGETDRLPCRLDTRQDAAVHGGRPGRRKAGVTSFPLLTGVGVAALASPTL